MSNLINNDNRIIFKRDHINENDIFTKPVLTTCTAQAYLTNVKFHEKDFQEIVEIDYPFVQAYSNYGETVVDGYTPFMKRKTSSRGRKKKPTPKTTRKVQGNGKCFCSQITFEFVCEFVELKDGKFMKKSSQFIKDFIATNQERTILKFKLFRNGKIQLPGVKQSNIDLVIWAAKLLGKMVGKNLGTKPELQFFKADMKNYKFEFKRITNNKHIIDLDKLYHLVKESSWVTKNNVSVKAIIKNFDNRKLSITFRTPNEKAAEDKIRVIVFPRGKVNILGAYDLQQTQEVYDFLTYAFDSKDVVISMLV